MGLSAIAIVLTSIPALFAFPHITIIQALYTLLLIGAGRIASTMASKNKDADTDGMTAKLTTRQQQTTEMSEIMAALLGGGDPAEKAMLCHNYYTPKVQKNVNNSDKCGELHEKQTIAIWTK